MYRRSLESRLKALAASFPAVFLTGPRQSGKTTLARTAFPDFVYISLEELDHRQQAIEDPRGFLSRFEGHEGLVLDEVQRAPDLFSYLQGFLDDQRGGPLILTGSQHFLLSAHIGQSLAGRAAILELLPLSVAELTGRDARAPESLVEAEQLAANGEGKPQQTLEELMLTGLFPRIHDRQLDATAWLDGYLRTYVERDVRAVSNVGDLDTFRRFVALCAGRSGQLLNHSALAADAGLSHSTARRWISILRTSYVLDLVAPHHENFNKRLVKTPKLYFLDTGLLCFLLGLRRHEDLILHPLRGAIFETFVLAELRKMFVHLGRSPQLYFWRDTNGREVDALLDLGTLRIPLEIKSGRTVSRDAFRGLEHYRRLSAASGVLIYAGSETHRFRDHLVRSWWQVS